MVTKEYLIEILKENKVFEEGDFTLASGKKSNYYVNMKRAITEPEILSTIAKLINEKIDDDIDKIKNLEFSPAPGVNKTEYHRYSIFKNADQDKVVESIMKLSNKSLHIYWEWLLLRYEVSWERGEVDNPSLHDDRDTLRIIQSELENQSRNCTGIQRFNLERIIKVIDYVCKAYQ